MQLKPSTYSSTTGKIKNSEERVKMDDVWFKEGNHSSKIYLMVLVM